MAVKRTNKIQTGFSLSSMTDIVFLLLIFFLVTSTLVNPNALKLELPQSTNRIANQPVSVTVSVDKNLVYYLNGKVIPFSRLESRIVEELKNTDDPSIIIQLEKSVPVDHLVRIVNIAKTYGYKHVLATDPE